MQRAAPLQNVCSLIDAPFDSATSTQQQQRMLLQIVCDATTLEVRSEHLRKLFRIMHTPRPPAVEIASALVIACAVAPSSICSASVSTGRASLVKASSPFSHGCDTL